MMSPNNQSEVIIKLHFNERYQQRVIEDAEPDSWIPVSISIDDEDIYGGEYSQVTGFACGIVLNLIDSLDAVESTERSIIEFENGPSWLTVDPIDETRVEITACHTFGGAKNPDERLDVDRTRTVQRTAWKSEVLDTSRDFTETVVELNPDLSDQDLIGQIRKKVQEAASSS